MALCTDDVDHLRYYIPYGYREWAFGMNKNVSKEKMEVIFKKDAFISCGLRTACWCL